MTSPRTRSTPFSGIASNAPGLFTVADGVELEPALDAAAELLEGAIDIARGVACRIKKSDGSAELWAALHALESAAAILQAIEAGLLEESFSTEREAASQGAAQ